MEETIFGINTVLETIKSHPERVHQIFLPIENLKGKKSEIYALARQHNIKIQRIPRNRFDTLVGKEAHQGVVGIVSPYSYQRFESLLEHWRTSQEKALFLILDGIEDPRNFGAIVRTANTVGVHGIIVPKHRSAPANQLVAKAAAGALAYTSV
ncbi:MAG: RNA methyltransferase substrate-binding domain-containing protein, partial [Pseudomonadota bacterium]